MDGYRLQIVKDGPTVSLYSRGGLDWSKRLAGLTAALVGIPWRSAIIDAELVFPGAEAPRASSACRLPWVLAGSTSSRSSPLMSYTATGRVFSHCP